MANSNHTNPPEKAFEKARETVAVSAEKSRERAADVLERLGGGLREQSARAARITQSTGDRLGSELERRAQSLRPKPSLFGRLAGYAGRHPFQLVLLTAFAAGLLIALPVLASRREGKPSPYL